MDVNLYSSVSAICFVDSFSLQLIENSYERQRCILLLLLIFFFLSKVYNINARLTATL